MTQTFENLVLNPVEFTPELPEVDLSKLGIAIGPAGPDYGESSIEVERVKRAIGEGVTSRHWPSVEATIPLILSSDPSVTQAAAYQPIERFAADVQRRGTGWIRRDMADAGGFAGSVGCPVDAAALVTPKGLGRVDEITLRLTRSPIWYATFEQELAEVKGVSVRDLEFEIAELLGTAPGLINLTIKNEGAEHWRGCLASIECDDYSSAATAKPHYSAHELTLQGGSKVEEGAGGKVVRCPVLTAGWQTVLSSKIAGVGHMTHVGPRRMLVRLDGGGLLGAISWKLEWRSLGAANWIQTMEGSSPIVRSSPTTGGDQLVDLGECRPERAITGNQRWEWRLQARTSSGGEEAPLIRDVYPSSTEQWVRVADASPDFADGAVVRSPGKAEDAAGVGVVVWASPENARIQDGVPAIAEIASGSQTSHFLKATNFAFAIPADATILGIRTDVIRRGSGDAGHVIKDSNVRIVQSGVIKEAQDKASASLWSSGFGSAPYGVASYGGLGDLWAQSWTPALVNAAGFGVAIAVRLGWGYLGPVDGIGVRKAEVDSISLTVYYVENRPADTRICFAARSMEFTNTGVRRQHPNDDVWGNLTPEGMLLNAPAPGQTDQPARALIVPSVGDFAARADSASVKLGASLRYRPGYLHAREATQ